MTSLGADTLLAEAARAASRRSEMPSPRNLPIDHFVVVMMENRSFDHYFGWADDVADAVQKQVYLDPEGRRFKTRHAFTLGRPYQGCGHPDPGHGWKTGRRQLKDGFMAEGSGNDEFALCYYEKGDLGFIHAAANRYTLYDRYFCSLLTSTFPNRYYLWSAQSAGKITNFDEVDYGSLGNQWETIFDRAMKRGLSARYYNSDLPFSAVWGPRAVPWTSPIARYYADCEAGTLPNIAFVDPPFVDGGGGEGLSADEHPLGDVRLGQAWMSDVVRAFVDSPNYRRGALFIVYDEWGGFFDHVRPPSVPDDRSHKKLAKDFGQMGFRIPAVAVSPYARNKKDDRRSARAAHGVYGHESILKFIEYRFGLGALTKRDRRTNNIGRSFNFRRPDFDRPDLPNPPEVAGGLCQRNDELANGRPAVEDPGGTHANDLAGLEELAERWGFPIGEPRYDQVFREPDSVRRAHEEAR